MPLSYFPRFDRLTIGALDCPTRLEAALHTQTQTHTKQTTPNTSTLGANRAMHWTIKNSLSGRHGVCETGHAAHTHTHTERERERETDKHSHTRAHADADPDALTRARAHTHTHTHTHTHRAWCTSLPIIARHTATAIHHCLLTVDHHRASVHRIAQLPP